MRLPISDQPLAPPGYAFDASDHPGRATTESARCDTCLMVVIAADIRAAQNAPINAENIKRVREGAAKSQRWRCDRDLRTLAHGRGETRGRTGYRGAVLPLMSAPVALAA
jgi:hypothetical protein